MTDRSTEDCTCKRCVTRTICDSEKALNSVSKIDRVSRVVFPTTYIVINIIYWSGYQQQNEQRMLISAVFRYLYLDRSERITYNVEDGS